MKIDLKAFALAWSLIDGLICGAVLAWLYNRFAKGKA